MRAQSAPNLKAEPGEVRNWRRGAWREVFLVTLCTSLLTSAVLAAPGTFRQSPAVSWRQFTTPALAVGSHPLRGVLLDCP